VTGSDKCDSYVFMKYKFSEYGKVRLLIMYSKLKIPQNTSKIEYGINTYNILRE
jgi:hypothetical protein